jgi:quinol-cytochrome oxidoreductase complex cytochrome b subunit
MKPRTIVFGLLTALAVVIGLTAYTWMIMADTRMSWNGIAAMLAGVGLSIGLGVGLMALVFHSHRSGHDDEVGHD